MAGNDKSSFLEFLDGAGGYGKAFAALAAAPAAGFLLHTQLSPSLWTFIGIPAAAHWIATSALVVASIIFFFGVWFARFRQESRLEDRDRFNLRATDRQSLIGRNEDVSALLAVAKRNRIVLLDGESGCGKSALVTAGLMPELSDDPAWLPLLVDDWGKDWETGPLATVIDTLFRTLGSDGRRAVGWGQAPDLAADASALAAMIGERLVAVSQIMGRRVLLILDQFDDYQARHRERFLTADRAWLGAEVLTQKNRFWAEIYKGLQAAQLHLIVVTRADTASGLASIRFPGVSTEAMTLRRVDADRAGPILAGLAPDDAQPPVISRPEQGWHELRQTLAAEIEMRGALLMQQFRLLLLGVRELPRLTLRHYRAAGGLDGVEALYVRRAVEASANGKGRVIEGEARALLAMLVDAGDGRQSIKTMTLAQSALLAGENESGPRMAILQTLAEMQVVRQVSQAGIDEAAWRLDHDYLARAVIADARIIDRWAVALDDGRRAYEAAQGNLRLQFRALLGPVVWARIGIERLRRRLGIGSSAHYFRVSMVKPLLLLLLMAMPGAVYWEMQRAAQVDRIVLAIGSANDPNDDVLAIWRGPEWLRERVFDRFAEQGSEGLSAVSMRTGWPAADVAWDQGRAAKMAHWLRLKLEGTEGLDGRPYASAFAAVAARVTDQAFLKTAAAALRAKLAVAEKQFERGSYVEAYAAVAARVTDQSFLRTEAAALRAKLEGAEDSEELISYANAYAAVAARVTDQAFLRTAAAALLAKLEGAGGQFEKFSYASAYAAVAARFTDQAFLRTEAAALRAKLEGAEDRFERMSYAEAYAAVAARVTDQTFLRTEAAALRAKLEGAGDSDELISYTSAFAAVAARVTDQSFLRTEAAALRAKLEGAEDSEELMSYANAYAAVAARVTDQAFLKTAAAALRAKLEGAEEQFERGSYVEAYAAVAARVTDQAFLKTAAKELRKRQEGAKNEIGRGSYASAYAAVAARVTDQSFLRTEAASLRAKLEGTEDQFERSFYASAFATVLTARLETAADADKHAFIIEALTMMAHPFVRDPKDFVKAIEAAAGGSFDGDQVKAFDWAAAKYGITRAELRPH